MDSLSAIERLEACPIISAVHEKQFSDALNAPVDIIFLLEGDVITVNEKIALAHEHGKAVLVHIDLMKGIGKDKCGVEFLAKCGADGIISTRAPLIKAAKEIGMLTVQRYFALDSQGLESITEMINSTRPDFVEIMPGVIEKVIKKFASSEIPVIAGGLLETKAEVTSALSSGALAISTGKKELWYI
ncbi:MAG: glycerol-3-phosphate responsive antiterminator [Clostridia bacterium]|nr:glycerol-3-phosphate responsive antiterminator [Clostridia bacterium]